MVEKSMETRPFFFPAFRSFPKANEEWPRPIHLTNYALYAIHERNLDAVVQEGIFHCRAGLGLEKNAHFLIHAHLDLTAAGEELNAKREISDYDPASLGHGLLAASRLSSNITTVPVARKNHIYGYLIATSDGKIDLDTNDVNFLLAMGEILGAAAERNFQEKIILKKLEKAEESKRHQELLTQEISHRVKNSFHLLGGLLSIQSRSSEDRNVRQALDEAVTRIYTIAQVYDELWRHSDAQTLNLKEFLGNLRRVLHATAPAHRLKGDIASIAVKPDQAITIALLCNELITNAVKYAYPLGTGEIFIGVAKIKNAGRLRLEVRDYGVGLPDNFSVTEKSGLGLKLTQSLSRQLGGEPKWESANPGTRFSLEFPL